MKILVPTKRVPDTDQKIHVNDDGTDIVSEYLPFMINPFDAIALEEAVRIAEESEEAVEIVAIGIGGQEYEKELRSALALGAERAVHVMVEQSLDSWNVAQILKAVANREQPNLIIMGKQAVDDDANQAGQFLAALLKWPQATFASNVKIDGSEILVDRETDSGIQRVRTSIPAVITVDLRLNEPRYASMPSIIKAKKKPIDQMTLDMLDVQIEPKIEILSLSSTSSQRTCEMLDTVDALIDRLKNKEKVI